MARQKTANRNLILFETALVVGLITILVENWIANLSLHAFWKVIIMMLFFGGIFSIFFKYIEPLAESTIKGIINKRRKSKFIIHFMIIAIMFVLYSLIYFNLTWI